LFYEREFTFAKKADNIAFSSRLLDSTVVAYRFRAGEQCSVVQSNHFKFRIAKVNV